MSPCWRRVLAGVIDMDIQSNLEAALCQLVTEFIDDPYRYFTEADAVSRFHEILETIPVFNKRVETKDGFQISLIHQEYPTFFRFDDKNPVARLDNDPKARRGHYDIVILNEEFIRTHQAETVKNRDITSLRDKGVLPIKAVVEFKLDDRGWSSGKTKGAIAEMDKLVLSKQEIELQYFVVLMRYTAKTIARWEKYWNQIEKASTKRNEIGSIYITHWMSINRKFKINSFGKWLSKYEEQQNG